MQNIVAKWESYILLLYQFGIDKNANSITTGMVHTVLRNWFGDYRSLHFLCVCFGRRTFLFSDSNWKGELKMSHTTVTFTHISNSSDFNEIEKELFERIKRWKNNICKAESVSMEELHWETSVSVDAEGNSAFVTITGFRVSEYRSKSKSELSEMLAEIKEDFEELEDELDEIECLGEEDYEEYDFESKEEYKEKLHELESDIIICKSEIELIEKILEEF